LIVQELLVRATSSLAVPDGPDYEDLGRNFRRIASTILDRHIAPHRAQLTERFERTRSAALALIAQELEASLCRRVVPATDRRSRSRWTFRFGKPKNGRSRRQRAPRSANDGPWPNGREKRQEATTGWRQTEC